MEQEPQINYSELIDSGMRAVVREVLRQIEREGLPGDHHFYITFRTDFPGVSMSETMRGRYPREMTVVLQHQFWDFRVEDQQFHVTLSFNGVPERLTIPFAAMSAFADPTVKFGLQFHYDYDESDLEDDMLTMEPMYEDSGDETGGAPESGKAEIISLDTFRKK